METNSPSDRQLVIDGHHLTSFEGNFGQLNNLAAIKWGWGNPVSEDEPWSVGDIWLLPLLSQRLTNGHQRTSLQEWLVGGWPSNHLLQALRKIDCNGEYEQITVDKSRPSGSWSLRRFPFVDGIIHLSKLYCVLCALSIVQMCKCASLYCLEIFDGFVPGRPNHLFDLKVNQVVCPLLKAGAGVWKDHMMGGNHWLSEQLDNSKQVDNLRIIFGNRWSIEGLWGHNHIEPSPP